MGLTCVLHARIQKVLSEGIFVNVLFVVDAGVSIPIPLLSGHHRPASKTPLKWRFAGVPMIAQQWILTWKLYDFQGIQTSFAEKTLYSCDFSGGGGGPDPLSPPPLFTPSALQIRFYHGSKQYFWSDCSLGKLHTTYLLGNWRYMMDTWLHTLTAYNCSLSKTVCS